MSTPQKPWFKGAEIIFCIAALLAVHLISNHFQTSQITYTNFWDGWFYRNMAEQFAAGEPIREMKPYVVRPGTPILAALANPKDVLAGFKTVNLIANVLTLGLFVTWIRLFITDWRIRCLLVLLLLTLWFGPFRGIYWYPAITDNWGYVFLLLGLLSIHWARSRPLAGSVALSAIVFVGTLFREPVFALAFTLVFVSNPIRFKGLFQKIRDFRFTEVIDRPRLVYLLPIPAAFLSIIFCEYLVDTTNEYTFAKAVLVWLFDKPILSYFHAMFITYGPLIVLVFFNWRRTVDFLATNQALLVFLLSGLVLAFIGGSDTERYWLWTMPVMYVLIGKAIIDNRAILNSKPLLAGLGITQMIAHRVFWTFPDWPSDYKSSMPFLTVFGNHCQIFDLYSYPARKIIAIVSFTEYVLLAILLIWWLARRAHQIQSAPAVSTLNQAAPAPSFVEAK